MEKATSGLVGKEITHADHLRRSETLMVPGSGQASLELLEKGEQQQKLQDQLEAIRRQNDEILRLLSESSQGQKLQVQLEVIRRQNDEILRFIRESSQESNQQRSPMQVEARGATTSRITADKTFPKYPTQGFANLGAREKERRAMVPPYIQHWG